MTARKVARQAVSTPQNSSLSKTEKKESSPPTSWLERIEEQLDSQRKIIVEEIAERLKSSEERVMQRFGELTAELANLKKALRKMEERVEKAEAQIAQNEQLQMEVALLKTELNECQNQAVSTDIIINGLPYVDGAIFTEDQRDSSVEYSFKYAVYRINKDKMLLSNTQLIYDIEYVPRDDSFRTTKKICRQLESGVQVIFGPTDPLLAAHVQSICQSFDVPHIETRIDFDTNFKEFSINLYPSKRLLSLAHRDLMIFLNWTKTAIIYEDDYGLFNQQDLMRSTPDFRTEMYIRQASPANYRQVLRAVRQKEIYKIIVDTNPTNINRFFRAILQLQMNDHRYHYMFTTFWLLPDPFRIGLQTRADLLHQISRLSALFCISITFPHSAPQQS
ncbi:PREDICTED: glutamate receptor ionotropic, kainate 1-like [Rhagoletis zephyria]|uniref:glutamate receptor ionotropic, kainate 1-like n=1 Tax=Rhagoletis zephyria TaxID=28612 RepID=UPI0008116BFA|nr:PREDICTED: glutamate receptor ionotropic, kainate 1-like [Rhagoletis zephyria]